ncbi:MAG TPA: hypothetical protein VF484_08250 [Candidatus Limnocylindrales bacterium]
MVDQQTPAVRSEDELEREDAAPREVRERRDDAGDLPVEVNRQAQADTSAPQTVDSPVDADTALFDRDASQGYKDRWLVIQTEFVDNPKAAVEKAEGLVGEVMQALTDSFARQRRELESGLARGDDASTEDLRQSIRRYRSFFNRLLAF